MNSEVIQENGHVLNVASSNEILGYNRQQQAIQVQEADGNNRAAGDDNNEEQRLTIHEIENNQNENNQNNAAENIPNSPNNGIFNAAANNGAGINPLIGIRSLEEINKIIQRDVVSKLRMIIVLFACVLAACILMAKSEDNEQIGNGLFIIGYVFFIALFLEKVYNYDKPFIHEWQQRESLFSMGDIVSILCLLLLCHLKANDKVESVDKIVIVHLANCIGYIVLSTAPKANKESQAILKITILLQIFFIGQKVDENISWTWLSTLCIVLFYLGFFSVYFILLLITLVYVIFKRNSPGSVYPGMDRNVQFVGVVYNFVTNGIAPIAIIGLCGYLSDQYSDFQGSYMQNCLKTGQAISITSICFTLIFWTHLKKFLSYFYKDELRATARVAHAIVPAQKPIVYVEKAKTYLVMLSSTYFVPLQDGLIPKDPNKVKEMKRSIQKKKTEKTESPLLKEMKTKVPSKILEDLKIEKRSLDRKVTNLMMNSHRGRDKALAKEVVSASMFDLEAKANELNKTEINISMKKIESDQSKICLSEGNMNASLIASQAGAEDENAGLCYICYTNEANAVMMNCGHGGVCYDCSVEFLLKKGECMECRSQVSHVVKIDRQPKLNNIVIGYELGKLTSIPA